MRHLSFFHVTHKSFMMIIAALSVLLCLVMLRDDARAAGGNLLWEDQFDGMAHSFDSAQAVTTLGAQVFVAGLVRNSSSSIGITDFAVRAYDAKTGELLWQDAINGGQLSGAYAIAASGGRVFVGGVFQDVSSAFVLRAYDANTGTLLWNDVVIAEVGCSRNFSIAADGNNVFAVGCLAGNFGVRAYDAKAGQLLWEDRVGVDGDTALAVAVQGNSIFVAGHIENGGSSHGITVRTYNAKTGELLWQASGTEGLEDTLAIVVQGNRVFTAGHANITISTGRVDFIVNAYDTKAGNLLWKDRIDSTANGAGEARDITVSGGRVYAVGWSRTSKTGDNFVVRAYDANTGALRWEDIVSGSEGGSGAALAVATRGNQVFVAGAIANVETRRYHHPI